MGMKTSVMFLLGSGVSIPGGFPSSTAITEQVLVGNGIFRHTDGRFYFSNNIGVLEENPIENFLSKVISVIQLIQQLMDNYQKREPLNYEIIYYIVQQLSAFESGDLLNMALFPFIRQVKAEMQQILIDTDEMIDVFDEAEKYIRHTVWRKLSIDPNKHQHLIFLSDAFKDETLSLVNVATLNHDLLIESHLTENSIDFHDGFGTPVNGVRYWESYLKAEKNLLKIHGSINWFNFMPDNGNWFDERIGIALDGDIDHAKSIQGRLMRSTPEKEPLILVGTFNKIYEYTESIFNDVYCQFRSLLNKSRNLVISGYGFGDKGVNTAILEWLYKDRSNKIIVIHPEPDNLLQRTARLAIRKTYRGVAQDNFNTIPKRIQDVTWEDIRARL